MEGKLLLLCIFSFKSMNKFLLKIGLAVIWFSALVVGMYCILHNRAEKSNEYTGEDEVFVWGDSQMYQGLDVTMLGNMLEKKVLTSAQHGSGIYDFLVSERYMPGNSVCLVSFSECAFFRNPMSDMNRTGFELNCLKMLYQSGCPLNECMRIAGLNRSSINEGFIVFRTRHSVLPYADTLVYPEPLPLWHSMFEEERDWFSWKAKAYEVGLQHLADKRCRMVLVQFPFDKQVEEFAPATNNRHLSDSLKEVLVERFEMRYDTIRLSSDSLLMHDLSHMNEIGARMLTLQVGEILKTDTVNNYFLCVVIE